MITSLIAPSPAISTNSTPTQHRGRRGWAVATIGAMVLATLTFGMGGTASAVTSPGTTTASVGVTSTIAMTGLTPAFTLTGAAGATVTGTAAVTAVVTTNNLAGYSVTVEAATSTLVATAGGNADSIPIGALTVKETSAADYTALSNTAPLIVHTQATRSIAAGDPISNDFQILIPFVNEDTYTATLNYIATTL